MTTILFYFLIVLALAGSSYYGWRSAKSAKNRQETQEQKLPEYVHTQATYSPVTSIKKALSDS